MPDLSPRILRHPSVVGLLRSALREDIGRGDLTTRLTVAMGARATANLRAREAGTAAGLPLLGPLFQMLDRRVRVRLKQRDGRRFKAGQVLAVLAGPARALLTGERVALNLLQQLCGVATLTSAYVNALRGTRCRLLDTRKTTPGLRLLEKYAVACGGGVNHRLRLDDAVLIKDNHIAAAGGVSRAIRLAKAGRLPVQCEVDSLAQLDEALGAGADAVLLDNMGPALLRRAVARVRAHEQAGGKRVLTEASGGVTLTTVRAIALSGVDRVSVGALTHSAPAIDLGLDFEWR
jgi:nicotinate-nucleotide pyrophosphorylase (carboxylating)